MAQQLRPNFSFTFPTEPSFQALFDPPPRKGIVVVISVRDGNNPFAFHLPVFPRRSAPAHLCVDLDYVQIDRDDRLLDPRGVPIDSSSGALEPPAGGTSSSEGPSFSPDRLVVWPDPTIPRHSSLRVLVAERELPYVRVRFSGTYHVMLPGCSPDALFSARLMHRLISGARFLLETPVVAARSAGLAAAEFAPLAEHPQRGPTVAPAHPMLAAVLSILGGGGQQHGVGGVGGGGGMGNTQKRIQVPGQPTQGTEALQQARRHEQQNEAAAGGDRSSKRAKVAVSPSPPGAPAAGKSFPMVPVPVRAHEQSCSSNTSKQLLALAARTGTFVAPIGAEHPPPGEPTSPTSRSVRRSGLGHVDGESAFRRRRL